MDVYSHGPRRFGSQSTRILLHGIGRESPVPAGLNRNNKANLEGLHRFGPTHVGHVDPTKLVGPTTPRLDRRKPTPISPAQPAEPAPTATPRPGAADVRRADRECESRPRDDVDWSVHRNRSEARNILASKPMLEAYALPGHHLDGVAPDHFAKRVLDL